MWLNYVSNTNNITDNIIRSLVFIFKEEFLRRAPEIVTLSKLTCVPFTAVTQDVILAKKSCTMGQEK